MLGYKPTRFWLNTSTRIFIPALVSILLFTATIFLYLIPAFEENMMNRKREMIRELIQSTWTLLEQLEKQVQTGEITREQAQREAVAQVSALRYGPEMKDYFWINDLRPRLIAHPYRPDLVGTDMTDYADRAGKRIFLEFARMAREQGAGYVDYMWQWKDDPNTIVPKVSYVQCFAPWGWVIGTGIYVEDVRAEIDALTRRLSVVCFTILSFIVLLLAYVTWQGAHAERQRLLGLEQIRLREAELAHVTRRSLLNELATGLAHELNQPLCAILGCGELSLRLVKSGQAGDKETLEALEEVVSQADRAGEIIRRMRNFAARRPAERAEAGVRDLVEEALSLMESQARRLSVEIKSRYSEENPIVCVDTIQIQQVIVNLVKNAFDALEQNDPATRRVEVRTRVTGDDEVEIGVCDNGPGIPSDKLDKIFSPFFTTKKDGIGIGLSLSRSIIEGHEGRLTVTPNADRGMLFTIVLPMYRKTAR
jgi:signal transduction histidine kinase